MKKTIENKLAKDALISAVSTEAGINTATTRKVLMAFCTVAKASLAEGTEVQLPNFGTFELHHSKPMLSNNVRTGKNGVAIKDERTKQTVYNPAHKRIRFKLKTDIKRAQFRASMELPAPEDMPEGTVLSRVLFEPIRIKFGQDLALQYPYNSEDFQTLSDGTVYISKQTGIAKEIERQRREYILNGGKK